MNHETKSSVKGLGILCEKCERNEAVETIEEETGDYSHWDGYVYTCEVPVCKECVENL